MDNISEALEKATTNIKPITLLYAGILLAICIVAVKVLMKLVKKMLGKSGMADKTAGIVSGVIKTVLYLISAVLALSTAGIDTSVIVAVFSVFSLGIVLAAESILSNVAGGIVLFSTRPFTVGDYIGIDDQEGYVQHIRLNHTEIYTEEGTAILIPNSIISSSRLVNYTRRGTRRLETEISVAYKEHFEDVKAACLRVCKALPMVLDDPEPIVWISSHDPSDKKFCIYCWVGWQDYFPAKYAIRSALEEEFLRNGIEITYSHLIVHMSGE